MPRGLYRGLDPSARSRLARCISVAASAYNEWPTRLPWHTDSSGRTGSQEHKARGRRAAASVLEQRDAGDSAGFDYMGATPREAN